MTGRRDQPDRMRRRPLRHPPEQDQGALLQVFQEEVYRLAPWSCIRLPNCPRPRRFPVQSGRLRSVSAAHCGPPRDHYPHWCRQLRRRSPVRKIRSLMRLVRRQLKTYPRVRYPYGYSGLSRHQPHAPLRDPSGLPQPHHAWAAGLPVHQTERGHPHQSHCSTEWVHFLRHRGSHHQPFGTFLRNSRFGPHRSTVGHHASTNKVEVGTLPRRRDGPSVANKCEIWALTPGQDFWLTNTMYDRDHFDWLRTH